jgi:hypothetical protein
LYSPETAVFHKVWFPPLGVANVVAVATAIATCNNGVANVAAAAHVAAAVAVATTIAACQQREVGSIFAYFLSICEVFLALYLAVLLLQVRLAQACTRSVVSLNHKQTASYLLFIHTHLRYEKLYCNHCCCYCCCCDIYA